MTEIDITPRELEMIRNLSESKFVYLLSVIDDKGWQLARILIPAMSY
jgi:5S rRNA maturation endonuclease (ribonuclease M5)